MNEEQIHRHIHEPQEPRLRVAIERGQRGSYGWTVSLEGTDCVALLRSLYHVDKMLRVEFLTENSHD